MHQSQGSQQGSQAVGRLIVESFTALFRSIALTVEIFLHNNFGTGYVACGLMGIAVMLGFGRYFADQELRPLLCFMALFTLRWLFVAICVAIRYWRGKDTLHSLYRGYPYACRFLPWKETTVKHLEPLLVILLGYGIRLLNVPLGDYLLFAASLVFVRVYGYAAQHRAMACAMNDRAIDQQLIAERFRDKHQS